ncbi:hypothetical protein H0E87_022791 [Populus deltoides]|uniref:Uncharacterized protein n=1 Tax=Populus deltoides TaxID=3696 RepID=A0A8T2XBK2_POPDE|nr:hypothetical protein H0E87_022791 [Populus deltoides]
MERVDSKLYECVKQDNIEEFKSRGPGGIRRRSRRIPREFATHVAHKKEKMEIHLACYHKEKSPVHAAVKNRITGILQKIEEAKARVITFQDKEFEIHSLCIINRLCGRS